MLDYDHLFYLSSWWDAGFEYDPVDKQYQKWIFELQNWGPDKGLREMTSGTWRIVEGSSEIHFTFSSDDQVKIVYSPWISTLTRISSRNMFLGLVLWLILSFHINLIEEKN
jgi:hypothetical protein